MRRVTRDATVGFHRRMFVNKGPLLVCVTLDAGGVRAGREPGLFEFEAAMRIMTIATSHRAFKNFVMERQIKLVLHFAVTTDAELGLAGAQ